MTDRKTTLFRSPGFYAALLAPTIFLSLLFLTESLPPVWDEADSFARADSVLFWSEKVVPNKNVDASKKFSEKTLQTYFPNTVVREGHPAGYTILIAAGKKAADFFPALSVKAGYRFGPILLFAIALAAAFYRVGKTFSLAAAFFSLAAILLQPRVFVHAQIAFGDSALLSSWLLTWATFDAALAKKRYAILWGIPLGLTFAAKFTGLLAAAPFGIFALGLALGLFRGERFTRSEAYRAAGRIFFLGFPAAFFVFYLLNPPIWHAPISGIRDYFYLNTHRGAYNISIRFLGELYNLDRSLPWWTGFFWTAVVVPAGLLFAALLTFLPILRPRPTEAANAASNAVGTSGAAPRRPKKVLSVSCGNAFYQKLFSKCSVFRLRRPAVSPLDHDQLAAGPRVHCIKQPTETTGAAPRLLLAMNFLLLPLIRVIPGLPVHDGVRLIIAAFPFLGILAGIGLAKCFERGRLWCRAAVGAILLSALADAVLFFPQGLSFYNILIGGVDGANRFGMEAAYYWDGLDREVTDWLNANTGKNEAVLFSAASSGVLRRLGEWGVLQPETETISSFRARRASPKETQTPMPKFRWYVLQNRGGGLTKPDRYLLEKKKPVRTKIVGTGRYAPPLSGETPIILIYRYRDFLEACRAN